MTMFDVKAICLKATPFKEADKVLSLYTAEHGELRAIAKGVKKPTSKLAGACEALTLNHVYLAKGKSLHTVCHYDRVESFSHLRQDLERLAAGSICTDVIRLLGRENDPDSDRIYQLLAETLYRLDNPAIPWIQSSLEFHLQMLKLAGYLPAFTRCVSCEKLLDLENTPYHPFFLPMGGFLCSHCHPLRTESHPVNVSTTTIKLFQSPDQPELYKNTLKAHRFLAYYWGNKLESPLKSFDFLFQLLDSRGPEHELALEGTMPLR